MHRAPQDPDYNPSLGYTDHKYLYTGGVNSFEYATNLPQQWQPNTVGRYRNCDPVLINYLNRLGHFKGSVQDEDEKSLNKAYSLLMGAVLGKKK